jgi:uncharacterized protein (UPF0216 family)
MIVTDEILNEWSFRCHDGVVDLNDPKKVRILKEILDENGINLEEEEAISFEQHLATKNLEAKTKEDLISSLSLEQQQKITQNLSDNINDIVSFLNSNEAISSILTVKTEGKSGVSLAGPGEVAIIVCSKTGQKITSGFGDVLIRGIKYEVKAGKVIRAGGTYKPSIVRLTTTLWTLKQDIFEGDNKEQYRNILGDDLFRMWDELGAIKGKQSEIDFTTIGKEKLSKIRAFLTVLRDKIKNIPTDNESKPNVISVGGKEFEVSQDELEKIQSSEPNQDLTVKGKVILSNNTEDSLTNLRQQLKVLLSSKILTSDDYDLDDAIKNEFIKDVDELVNVVGNKYTVYDKKQFIDKWEFRSLTQGNRPQFSLKGANITEEEEYEF